ncbi:MAG: hypothetical protein Kow0096_12620 [Thiohalomonadaceae bacterium]
MRGGLCALLLLCAPFLAAQEPTPEELERWFEDDTRAQPYDFEVNSGELEFLAVMPDKRVPHSRNRLRILPSSLDDGWLEQSQCHENLDPVPLAEVVYKYREMRDLRVVSASGIERAWVEGQSVQMENISHRAVLCVAAAARLLRREGDEYVMRNGPFQRRFLDGYFPLRVSLTLEYPAERLRVVSVAPPGQPGFAVRHEPGRVILEALFEGRLYTEVRFRAAQP